MHVLLWPCLAIFGSSMTKTQQHAKDKDSGLKFWNVIECFIRVDNKTFIELYIANLEELAPLTFNSYGEV